MNKPEIYLLIAALVLLLGALACFSIFALRRRRVGLTPVSLDVRRLKKRLTKQTFSAILKAQKGKGIDNDEKR